MIKLKKLIMEDLDKDNFGKKFIGSIDELTINKKLQELNQKDGVQVINKKSGVTYQVSKNWYQKHKELYNQPKKQKNKLSMVGNNNQITKYKFPQNAEQFIKMYIPESEKQIEEYHNEVNQQANYNYNKVRQLGENYKNAIMYYTMNDYLHLNRLLLREFKGVSSDNTEFYMKQVNDIRKALSVCKPYNGICYRIIQNAVNQDPLQFNLKPGDIFQCNAFTSTSHNRDGFSYIQTIFLSSRGGNEFCIKSKNGKIIEKLSDIESQQQVLFDINSKFKVIDVKDKETETIGGVPVKIKVFYVEQI